MIRPLFPACLIKADAAFDKKERTSEVYSYNLVPVFQSDLFHLGMKYPGIIDKDM